MKTSWPPSRNAFAVGAPNSGIALAAAIFPCRSAPSSGRVRTVALKMPRSSSDGRVVRNGAFPVIGREAVRGFLTDRKVSMAWEPLKGETSRAGDFGYTYGTYEEASAAGTPEKGHYLRIWKRQGGDAWKLVLDITNPLPPPKPPQ